MFFQKFKQTLALHFKCRPGTDRDVINIVKQRRKNTEPNNENVLLNIINLKYKLKILYFIRSLIQSYLCL